MLLVPPELEVLECCHMVPAGLGSQGSMQVVYRKAEPLPQGVGSAERKNMLSYPIFLVHFEELVYQVKNIFSKKDGGNLDERGGTNTVPSSRC